MTAAAPVFIGSEIYRGSSYGGWHPLRIARVSTVIDLGRTLGWLPAGAYRTSPRARPAALTAFHTPAYIAALLAAEASQSVSPGIRARHGLGTTSNPVFPAMFRRPATAAGGSLLGAEMVARGGGTVFSPGGGTHHGMADRANGFCYLNDPVLAILALRRHGMARVAYVDIDAHHPDGVEPRFAGDAQVLMISVHEEDRWPRTGALGDRGVGNLFNLPVPRGFHDDDMALAADRVILPAVASFRPDAVVLQCGADAVAEDPLSRLTLSNNPHRALALALRALSPRLLVLGGGGYNPWSAGRLWTALWGALAGHDLPDRLPPGAEAVLRGLTWSGMQAARERPVHWFTTLADAPRNGPVSDVVRARVAVLADRLRIRA